MSYSFRRRLIFGLLKILRNKIGDRLVEIEKLQYIPDDELKKYQEDKLKEILIYAYKNVPYYTKVLSKNEVIDSNLDVNLDNFEKIPILTKDIIRDNFEDLKSKELNQMKWKINKSGGSTGEPVKIVQDSNYTEWNIANKLFYKHLGKSNIGDREMRFWGQNYTVEKKNIITMIRNKIYNRCEITIFQMSDKDMERYVKKWNRMKPQWVEGYVEAVFEFAKYCERKNIRMYKPKGILTTAGTLYPDTKKYIESVFGCRVYNRYGSREVGDMAFGEDELMLSVWNNKIEILDPIKHNKAKSGCVIVTTLNNRAMPLIRYNIGDVATMGDKWNELKEVKGREISMFKGKNGKMIDGSYFTHSLTNKNWIKRYQVVQRKVDEIEYIFQSLDENHIISDNDKKSIETHARKMLGKNCKIKFTFVKNIDTLKSGKHLYTRSEVK